MMACAAARASSVWRHISMARRSESATVEDVRFGGRISDFFRRGLDRGICVSLVLVTIRTTESNKPIIVVAFPTSTADGICSPLCVYLFARISESIAMVLQPTNRRRARSISVWGHVQPSCAVRNDGSLSPARAFDEKVESMIVDSQDVA